MIRTVKRIFKSELFWFVIFTIALYALAYIPVINRTIFPPLGRTYLGFNAYAIDQLGDLSLIQEGYSGRILREPNMSSSLVGKSFFVKTEYLVIGNIARILNIHPLYMFRIMIAVNSFLYILVLIKIIRQIFHTSSERVLAYGLSLFGTGILMPNSSTGWENIAVFSQVFQRTTMDMPHYLLSSMFLLLSVYYLAKTFNRFFWKTYILSLICGIITSQLFFPPILILYTGFVIYFIFRILQKINIDNLKKELILTFFYSLFVSLPFWYLWYTSHFFDMNIFRFTEHTIPPVVNNFYDYMMVMGLLLFYSVSAIFFVIQKKQIFFTLAMSWIIVHPIVLFLIFRLTNTNPVRSFQTPYYVMLAILSTYGIINCYRKLSTALSRIIGKIIISLLLIVLIISCLPAYIKSFHFNEIGRWDNPEFGYPGGGEFKAMMWLNSYCNDKRTVMSSEINGTLILALTPCRVYLSSWVRVSLIEEASTFGNYMTQFYQENLPIDVVKNIIIYDNISYIYYGNSEQYIHSLNSISRGLSYSFLEKIYDQDGTIIYMVNQSRL